MRMRRNENWREFDREAYSGGWRMAGITLVVILACSAMGGVGWLIKVALSDVKGAGDATVKINSADNRLQQQELFQDLYRKIQENELNLKQACADKWENKGKPSESFHNTNYSGMVMAYNQSVTEYNAQTQKARAEKWLPASLPTEITPVDLVNYCKEPPR